MTQKPITKEIKLSLSEEFSEILADFLTERQNQAGRERLLLDYPCGEWVLLKNIIADAPYSQRVEKLEKRLKDVIWVSWMQLPDTYGEDYATVCVFTETRLWCKVGIINRALFTREAVE